MNWNKFAWLKRGNRRIEVLQKINFSKTPLTIKEIKQKSKIALSQASATVKELFKKKLIDCLNPKDKIGKLYRINKTGQELLGELKK